MKRILTSLIIALIVALITCAANAQTVTLEKLLSAPFPSEVSAAPAAPRVAWIQTERGVCNLFVADAPDYRARQLTKYTRDDGQRLSNITWSSDAKTIVYVRGDGANRAGENPNPTSDPAGAEQALWRISADGGEPVRIGLGSAPALAPRGDQLVFLRRGQIFATSLSDAKEPKQLLILRGGSSSLRWSPDGAKLAFVSNRGDHAFIGVYEIASKDLRWLAASVDQDGNPAWSPDGSRLVFTRTPFGPRPFFAPERSALPWSIVVADVASGKAKVIWRADEGVGSVFQGVAAENQLMWSAADRIVFPWERDGWIHLYSVAASGGTASLLTPGAFEVEYATLSPDKREVIFNSNQDDIDRRHLWRVAASGGKPSAITSGKGIEWMPQLTADGKSIAYLRSDARRPAQAVIQSVGGHGNSNNGEAPAGMRELSPIPNDFPVNALVEPQAVMIIAADGMQIHAQLFLPKIPNGEKRPAAIFFHGGSRRQMLLGFHYFSYYHNTYAMNQYLASQGYIALSVNYRSGTGYGMEFREALNYGAVGASEFRDVIGAGLYLRGRQDVDARRIGIWGGSYGGYLTAMGLSRASDLFAAGVDIHGVHDWNTGIKNFMPTYNPLENPKESKLAFDSSPLASVDSWRSPVLMIHGDDDRNVNFNETVTLVRALRERKVEVEQLVFPDEIHGFLLHRNWMSAFTAAADFFDRKLRK
jgi:dipeptidyl aminopeptidase/acylaminoacyl peptidase